ncbi:GNAT family N-acetyltransferase [Mediterraneibacter massiliensis]|uniref:GNAT family N-acetyltransferase n=1 Tax=Mediterraneibacter massiliensis TaxID=1720300 RepID=UPI000E47B8ED|nr:GNAT family protein [Mediterraneibacter massiliensis]RGT72722.1 N-acetyltransferase [Ruminococcus sp. AF18-22]
MKIRKSTMDDLSSIQNLYEKARYFMSTHGNPSQWGSTYPEPELIKKDIETEHSYVCETDKCIVAVFYYNEGEDHTYQNIYNGKWINTAPYGVVHRITSDGTAKGAASFCLDWAFKKCRNLKIDTHKDNQIMQHLLEKNGFTYCGIIYTDDGTKRLAYQKC